MHKLSNTSNKQFTEKNISARADKIIGRKSEENAAELATSKTRDEIKFTGINLSLKLYFDTIATRQRLTS